VTAGTHALLEPLTVVANERVAEKVGLITFEAPRIARTVAPGQFIHLRIESGGAQILRRPFSVHRVSDTRIEVLYQVVGAGTARLAGLRPGENGLDAIGPLGHGWWVPEAAAHALLVTGGLGAAPMGALADLLAAKGAAAVIAMGAPCAERLVAREHFEQVARRVEVATDDGSAGEPGLVTVLSERLLSAERFDVVYACGPEGMQRAVAAQAAAVGVSCQVSLERLMACGIGACLSCVVTTHGGRKRACVDGPVFDAGEVVWDASEVPPKH